MVRLAHGVVVGRGLRVWRPGAGRGPVEVGGAAGVTGAAGSGGDAGGGGAAGGRGGGGAGAPPGEGAAVVVGPAGASGAEVRRALGELARLVDAAGVTAAGAGVDLGDGFHSARLEGAGGDRRDAVFAALRALRLAGIERLGDRAGVLVALFGPAATKPVAAAASEAIEHGRWAALHLASAASDLLVPEQLEPLLRLAEDPDAGHEPGPPSGAGGRSRPSSPSRSQLSSRASPPSVLADHLARVLDPVPRARRPALLVDLWERVRAHRRVALRRERLARAGGDQNRLGELRARYREHADERVLSALWASTAGAPTLVAAARWVPSAWHWTRWLTQGVCDSIAATALMRTAIAVSDHGVAEGLARSAALLDAAAAMLDRDTRGAGPRRADGLPAVPGRYVHDLNKRLRRTGPDDPRVAMYARQRLVRSRDYGTVVLEAVTELMYTALDPHDVTPVPWVRTWAATDLREWRAAAGYSGVRPPAEWAQPVAHAPWDAPPAGAAAADVPDIAGIGADAVGDGGPPARPVPLADRMRQRPGDRPEEVECLGDLLWLAELADAVAQLHGHDRAWIEYARNVPRVYADRPEPRPSAPLRPRTDSISLAVAGAAQLVSLGGRPPARCRTWPELVDGLTASTAISEALTGGFELPAALAERDGSEIPGTGTRVEWARDPRMLAEWSEYMGNCIASSGYIEWASAGNCVLAALRDADGGLVANLELTPVRPGRGWRLTEIRARFNSDPDPELVARVRNWVATLSREEQADPAEPGESLVPDASLEPARGIGRAAARRRGGRLLPDVGGPLVAFAEAVLADPATVAAGRVLAALAPTAATTATTADAPEPRAALTALRRIGPDRLTDVCRTALPEVGLARLWSATGVRPMTAALAGLDQDLWERYERVGLLAEDGSLPGSLRTLARRPAVAPARTFELVARRVRLAIGRLARDGDGVLDRCVADRPTVPALCALVVAVVSWQLRGPAGRVDLTPVPLPDRGAVPGLPGAAPADEPWLRASAEARELGADTTAFWERVTEGSLLVPTAWLGGGGWPALWRLAARNTR